MDEKQEAAVAAMMEYADLKVSDYRAALKKAVEKQREGTYWLGDPPETEGIWQVKKRDGGHWEESMILPWNEEYLKSKNFKYRPVIRFKK